MIIYLNKRLIFLFFSALFTIFSLQVVMAEESIMMTQAPVIWTVPSFPTKFDDVTVYFDASQGNAALNNFSGDVYAHTGVITDQSSSGTDWKHVIGNWGTADARVLMTRESANIYSISFNISEFYGIPLEETVLKLAFVFRNVSGSIVGRDTDGSDIFADVSASNQGLYLNLRSPESEDVIIYEDDSLFIDVLVSDTANLTIFDNGTEIFSGFVDAISFYYHPLTTGNHTLTLTATRDTLIFTLDVQFLVLKRNPVKRDPPDGTMNGLNYFSATTYIFQLYAPLKEYVFLLTTSNQYKPDTTYLLHQAEDGKTFWIELPRSLFADGKTTYQYLINGGIKVADPHSEVVLDPDNDPFIDDEVMATLPPYPVGMTTGIVTAFDEDYEAFDFEVTDFVKPEKSKLVIYELLIRDFIATHNYETLKDTLSYFENLGVNVIQLMPVNEFEGNISWGYNPSFHMAVDKYYGTREQLKAFVDEAHKHGIAIVLDVVFNHTFSQGPLAKMYWDAINFRPAANSPYLNVIPKHPFNVGYDFNHESLATKIWVKRVLNYWVNEFKVDGFRFDLSKGMTQFNSGNDAGLMARYDASRIALLKDYANSVWNNDSTSYLILEHFADNDEETELSSFGFMLWGNSNYQYNQAAKGFQSDLDWSDYSYRGWTKPHLVSYMESHDEERLMVRLKNEGDIEGDYNTRELKTALKRVAAASAIHYSIPGPKMIWEFGELGYDYSINTCSNGTISNDCRLDPKPIRWDYLNNPDRERLRQVTAALIKLKTDYPTFSTTDFDFNDGNLYIKTVHLNHPDMDAATLVNFRVVNSDINPKFQYPGVWYEYFTGDSIEVTDTQEKITFGPGEYRIYTSIRITPPDGYVTGTTELSLEEIQIYPNLLHEESSVAGYLPDVNSIENITLTDIQGKRIQLPGYNNSGGNFSVTLPSSMVSGLYFLTVQTDKNLFIAKLIKQ
ncbi:MAG: alpha-amylase family glycosyl hydrolase [Bacteroidota bacterium]|nr:alpha-amylase family glycosyl hydrolase [Bacteroidota bacterium]